MTDRAYGVTPPLLDLQQRLGGPIRPLEESEIEQLQAVLEEFASGMGDWIKADLARLIAARNAFLDDSHSQECIDNLHRAAHDLKGLGQTYGFPVVSVIASALCKAIHLAMESGAVPEDLVNAHVDALRAIVNLNLRDPSSGPAVELICGLQSLVDKKIG